MKSIKTYIFITTIFLLGLNACNNADNSISQDSPKYKPTFESLATHPVPQWFDDAKFGIFIHWGVYAVPAYNEWFLPMMSPKSSFGRNLGGPPYTAAQDDLSDSVFKANIQEKANKFQRDNYGVNFEYDEFIPMFKAENFNPDNWATLFKEAGAKYVVMTAKHGDEFALWPSKYDKRNSMSMGPQKDLLGEVSKSVKNAGLKMGFYINTTYSFWDERFPNKEWVDYNNNCIKELVDMYHPSILWGDVLIAPVKNENGGGPLGDDHFNSKQMLAYFYNHSQYPDEVLTNDRWGLDTTQKDEHSNRYIMNSPYEGYKKDIKYRGALLGDYATPERYNISQPDTDRKWETCDSMDPTSWGYNKLTTDAEYMTSNQIIDYLADIVSKGGNLLLNIGPKSDGTIPDIMQSRLKDVGKWLSINGEAIYGSKPWKTFGQGPTQGFVGTRGGATNKYNFVSNDIRFTRKANTLYAIILGWPEDDEVFLNLDSSPAIQNITLLGGSSESLKWNINNGKIQVKLPSDPISPFANTLKIDCNSL